MTASLLASRIGGRVMQRSVSSMVHQSHWKPALANEVLRPRRASTVAAVPSLLASSSSVSLSPVVAPLSVLPTTGVSAASIHTTTVVGKKKKKAPTTPAEWPEDDEDDDDSADDDGANTAEDAKAGLIDMLTREYDEEQLNKTTQKPEELVKLQKQLEALEWKVIDGDAGTAYTRLVKTDASGLKVQVSFHCQDMMEDPYAEDMRQDEQDEEEEEGQEGHMDDEDDDDESSSPIRFTVLVSKAGQTLVFGCLSQYATCEIQSVALTTNSDDATLLARGSVLAEQYQGPEFVELADDLQYAFADYLERDVGISEDVAAFVAMYADYQEQQHYVDFLERAKRLLS